MRLQVVKESRIYKRRLVVQNSMVTCVFFISTSLIVNPPCMPWKTVVNYLSEHIYTSTILDYTVLLDITTRPLFQLLNSLIIVLKSSTCMELHCSGRESPTPSYTHFVLVFKCYRSLCIVLTTFFTYC